MKNFIKNNWQILIPELLIIISFITFWGRFGDIVIDSYREVYIPQQILEGKVLYKDLFVIYPPLAYLINAFLMKIFGIGQNIIIFAGLITTIGITYFTNKISQLFLNKLQTFSICLFLTAGLVLSSNVFNSFLPYSYGILYGILCILISIYYAQNKKFPISYLFYSLALLCKYEFLLLFPLLLFWSKKLEWKKNLLAFFSPIFITFSVLYIQGLRTSDIITALSLINMISNTKTLYWFYSTVGLVFRLELIPIYFTNFAKFLVPIYWGKYQEVIIWSLPLIFLLGIFRYKKLNINEKFIILSTILISAKVFFALTLQSYGVYFIPFVLISLFILTPIKARKLLVILLIVWSFIIGFFNIQSLCNKKTSFNTVVEYIKQNTKPEDKVVVYPECLNINVLTNRKSDNKFYSLIPLYVETFGEDLIIKRLENTLPKYIIINNYDTSAYYFKEFGLDYAQNIFEWIEKNYNLETTIKDRWLFKIYHLKNS